MQAQTKVKMISSKYWKAKAESEGKRAGDNLRLAAERAREIDELRNQVRSLRGELEEKGRMITEMHQRMEAGCVVDGEGFLPMPYLVETAPETGVVRLSFAVDKKNTVMRWTRLVCTDGVPVMYGIRDYYGRGVIP